MTHTHPSAEKPTVAEARLEAERVRLVKRCVTLIEERDRFERDALRASLRDEDAAAAKVLAENDALRAETVRLRERLAHVVRDHDMPPNKDRHGYDYRMGWWDAVVYADRIIQRGVRYCEDCPGKIAPAAQEPRP